MWQIGIDVLPEYRRMGIASTLVNRLAREILSIGKVPFYCSRVVKREEREMCHESGGSAPQLGADDGRKGSEKNRAGVKITLHAVFHIFSF